MFTFVKQVCHHTLNFSVWSPGMCQLLNSYAVRLPEI